MTRLNWEYRTVTIGRRKGFFSGCALDSPEIERACNALGAEGWELGGCPTSLYDRSTINVTLIFKRPVWVNRT